MDENPASAGGHRFSREDSTCHVVTKPMCHNCRACTPTARALHREAASVRRPITATRKAPAHNWRKPVHSNEDPAQPKINK